MMTVFSSIAERVPLGKKNMVAFELKNQYLHDVKSSGVKSAVTMDLF